MDRKISTWLHRVVNVCLMKLRSSRNRPSSSIESLLPAFDDTGHHFRRISAWETPQDRLQKEELRTLVREQIAKLPETYRVVLLLRDIEELDTQETAAWLGICGPAVKIRLHRARQGLRSLHDPMLFAG